MGGPILGEVMTESYPDGSRSSKWRSTSLLAGQPGGLAPGASVATGPQAGAKRAWKKRRYSGS